MQHQHLCFPQTAEITKSRGKKRTSGTGIAPSPTNGEVKRGYEEDESYGFLHNPQTAPAISQKENERGGKKIKNFNI